MIGQEAIMRALGKILVWFCVVFVSTLNAAPEIQQVLSQFVAALNSKNFAAARQFIDPEFSGLLTESRRICKNPEITRSIVQLFGQQPKTANQLNGLLVLTTSDTLLRKRSLAFQVMCHGSGTRWRLAAAPDKFTLLRSQIDLRVFPEKMNLIGEQRLLIQIPTNHASALAVVLADGLRISGVRLGDLENVEFLPVGTFDHKNIWIIQWPAVVGGNCARLTIQFNGHLPDASGSAPINSRRCYFLDEFAWHPCFLHETLQNDRPFLENNFPQTLSIKMPHAWNVVSNGRLVKKSVDPLRNQAVFIFEMKGAVGQKYSGLNWVAAPNWVVKHSFFGENALDTYCYRTPDFPEKALKFNELNQRIISIFEQNYSKFPLSRCDVVEISDFPERSRNCGSLILIDEFDAHPDDSMISRLAHEIAHTWFGNTLRAHGKGQDWLCEGFAAFSEQLFWAHYHPERLPEINKKMALRYFSAVDPKRDLAIVRIQPGYSSRAGAILQGKGGYVLWMLRSFLGADLFKKIMQEYSQKYAGCEPSVPDFIRICAAHSPKKLGGFFKQWLNRPGAPEFLFHFNIEPENGQFKITGKIRQTPPDIYRVPAEIVIETRAGVTIKTVWIDARDVEFSLFTRSEPIAVRFDPQFKLLRHTEELDRIAFIQQSIRKGQELAKLHKYNEALKLFQLALAQDSTQAEILYQQGKIYANQQQYHSAFLAFEKAAKYSRDQPWIEGWSYFRMGQIYDRLHLRDQAISHFQKALECADTFRLHKSARTQIRSLFFANGDAE
jgi:tetratricopeptide (TPR) repeat protein